jgi:gliding motility-associated-like protein
MSIHYISRLSVIISLFFSYSIFAEICDNGIDDDGDGLIDLLDPDCICNQSYEDISHIIPNPSFEDTSCCPINWAGGNMNCLVGWNQASYGTPDYSNSCSQTPGVLPQISPLPHGNGVLGFLAAHSNIKEYIGACLNDTMHAGTEYNIDFSGFLRVGAINEIAIFGSTSCQNFPLGSTQYHIGCASNDSNWVFLGSTSITNTGTWQNLSLNFTPNQDITAIAIGPSCNPDTIVHYINIDDLSMGRSIRINSIGNYCHNNLILGTEAWSGANFQWYHNGIAIIGATDSTYAVQNVNGGYYQVYVSDNANCFISNKFYPDSTLFNPFVLVNNVTCGGLNDGSIILDSTYSNFLNNSPVNSSIYGLSIGQYNLTVSNGNCQFDTVIIIDSNLTINIATDTSVCLPNGNGHLTAQGSNGAAPYQYHWSNGQFGDSIQLINYYQPTLSVHATDQSGCTSDTMSILFRRINLDSIEIQNSTCSYLNNGYIEFNPIGGLAPYSFQINQQSFTFNNVFSNLDSGWFSLTVKDSTGCNADTIFYVDEPEKINVLSTIDSVKCFGENTGSIFLEIDGGIGSYHTAINSQNPQVTADTISIDSLSSGIYLIVVTDSLNCSDSSWAQVFEPIPLSFDVSYQNVACAGRNNGEISIQNTIGGAGSYMYTLSYGTVTTNGYFTGLDTGIYQIMVNDQNACSEDTTVEITISDPIKIKIDSSACRHNGDILQPILFGQTSNTSYYWNNQIGDSSFIINYPEDSLVSFSLIVDSVCVSDTIQIRSYQFPDIQVTSDSVQSCHPIEMMVQVIDANLTNAYTTLSISNTNIRGLDSVMVNLSEEGFYDLQIHSISPFGCVQNLSIPNYFVIASEPKAQFRFQNEIGEFNDEIFVINESMGANKFKWYYDHEIISEDFEASIEVIDNLYENDLCLIAETPYLCLDTFCQELKILEPHTFYIPNSFTPNQDGINDNFGPIISGDYESFKFDVFNRWGSLIFQSENPDHLWNGYSLARPKPCPEGVYMWQVEIKRNGGFTEQVGYFTLIR